MVEEDLYEKLKFIPEIFTIAEKVQECLKYCSNTMLIFFHELIQKNKIIQNTQQQLEKTEEKLNIQINNNDEISQMLQEKNKLLKEILVDYDPKDRKAQKKTNFMGLENQKLQIEIEQLSKKLKNLESGHDMMSIQQELEKVRNIMKKQSDNHKSEIEQLQKEMSKQKAAHTTLQTNYQKNFTELKAISEAYDRQNQQFEEIYSKNAYNEKYHNQWRERAQMQQEDYYGQIQKNQVDIGIINRLSHKCSELQHKLDKFHVQRSKEIELPMIEETKQGQDLIFFTDIEKTFSKNQTYKRQTLKQGLAQLKDLKLKEPIKAKILSKWGETLDQPISQKDNVDLNLLQIYLPNFYVFIESNIKPHENEINHLMERKISLQFLPQLRAILDAKYNEFLFANENQFQNISRFPDFVYSWFQNYVIDDQNKKPRIITEQEKQHTDEARTVFLLDLLNPKLQSLWEFVTFKEFLAEQLPQDELFFYLHCRHMLFNGNVINHSKSPFEVILYVDLKEAEILIDSVMKRYDNMSKVYLKSEMKERVKEIQISTADPKKQKIIQAVDSGFILRSMLHYYKSEKQQQYKALQEAFQAVQTIDKTGKFNVNFINFRKVLEVTFHNATSLEIANMYREAYAIGQGRVQIENFYTVANQSGFFLKFMKLPGKLVHYPITEQITKNSLNNINSEKQIDNGSNKTLENNENEQDQSQKSQKDLGKNINLELTNDDVNQEYNMFITVLQRYQNLVQPLFQVGKSLGVEHITQEIIIIENLIKNRFSDLDLLDSVFKGKPLIFLTHRIMNVKLIYQILCAYHGGVTPKLLDITRYLLAFTLLYISNPNFVYDSTSKIDKNSTFLIIIIIYQNEFYEIIMYLTNTIKNLLYYQAALNNEEREYFTQELDQVIANDFQVIETTLRTVQDWQYKKNHDLQIKNKNATILQKFVRKKIQKFYSVIASVLSANLKNFLFQQRQKNKKAGGASTIQTQNSINNSPISNQNAQKNRK
ncbi:hypothetical protein PPERSA_11116 [Pseudocohnilembus persalinus]|uniref:Uncharacterized protein n=1 Tax=Pseudocohnilembus persalinus TaxID=266149 RepID=A0A0V0QZ16_PSEPJ|nr:hypothetical protein PPERSA_11116 [Pseudocohnilembus persalinus]|eukprot:KRX07567.1 hypothetical protein PPERSA_11116 [Pseudocohnilembus persalinus]